MERLFNRKRPAHRQQQTALPQAVLSLSAFDAELGRYRLNGRRALLERIQEWLWVTIEWAGSE